MVSSGLGRPSATAAPCVCTGLHSSCAVLMNWLRDILIVVDSSGPAHAHTCSAHALFRVMPGLSYAWLYCILREWTLPATGTTPGPKTATAELTQPDSNPSNNKDDVLVEFFLTCSNPFGNGTFSACPAGSTYVGPNNQGIAASADFAAICCVSLPHGCL